MIRLEWFERCLQNFYSKKVLPLQKVRMIRVEKKSKEFLFIFVLISKLILVTYDSFHVPMAMAMCWDHSTARVIPPFHNMVQA